MSEGAALANTSPILSSSTNSRFSVGGVHGRPFLLLSAPHSGLVTSPLTFVFIAGYYYFFHFGFAKICFCQISLPLMESTKVSCCRPTNFSQRPEAVPHTCEEGPRLCISRSCRARMLFSKKRFELSFAVSSMLYC